MLAGILGIAALYGLGAALVHACYYFHKRNKKNRTVHLVLITQNNQSEIEWYLVSYLFFSWLRGRQTEITVFDDGSTDETCTIITRMAEERQGLTLYAGTEGLDGFLAEHEHCPLLLLRLSQVGLDPELPLNHW